MIITLAAPGGAPGPLVWAGTAVGVAAIMTLGCALIIGHRFARPLRDLTASVRRFSAGDHSARVTVGGPACVREAARAVNQQLAGSERFRADELEGAHLRAMARVAGLSIRDQLTANGVIEEAREILDKNLPADRVYLYLIIEGVVQPPIGHERDWDYSDAFKRVLPEESVRHLRELFRAQSSTVVNDVRGEEGEELPAWVLPAVRASGVVGVIATPFGVGEEMLGYIVVHRFQEGHPWKPAEVDAVESIAADLGRGLHHARLYERERHLVEDLKSLDQARSDFFATVSHDMRAPLTSIKGFAEMLGDPETGDLNPAQRRLLKSMDRSVSRLQNLIEDVFELAKLESGASERSARPVDLATVLSDAVDSVSPLAVPRELTLSIEPPGAELVVNADARQLDEVFVNLLTNAVKFTPEDGRIEVTGGAENGWVVTRVSDNGIGIPEADQQKLFTKFFRASNAHQQQIPGTGLGLAIVRGIVVRHGGEISVSSRAGQGSTFTVRLPRSGAPG